MSRTDQLAWAFAGAAINGTTEVAGSTFVIKPARKLFSSPEHAARVRLKRDVPGDALVLVETKPDGTVVHHWSTAIGGKE